METERCAHLFDAAEGMLRAIEAPAYEVYGPNRSFNDQTRPATRSRPGEEARERRREMTFEQAVDDALDATDHEVMREASR